MPPPPRGRAGVHHAIGLQGRAAPAACRARELITGGAIGRPLSARILSTTAGYAPALPSAYAYLNDPANGANLSTILGGHTLDLAEHLLGAAVEIEAMSAIQFPSVRLLDTGGTAARTTPDQLFTLTRHESGCLLSTEIGGNRPAATPFAFEVIGTDGRLRLFGGHPHGFQAGTLSLEANVAFPRPTRRTRAAACSAPRPTSRRSTRRWPMTSAGTPGPCRASATPPISPT